MRWWAETDVDWLCPIADVCGGGHAETDVDWLCPTAGVFGGGGAAALLLHGRLHLDAGGGVAPVQQGGQGLRHGAIQNDLLRLLWVG